MNRELDARVAEAMGQKVEWLIRYGEFVSWFPSKQEAEEQAKKTGGKSCDNDAPAFSSDPTACEMVKAWLRDRDVNFMVGFQTPSRLYEAIYFTGTGLSGWSAPYCAKSEYEAVCQMALAVAERLNNASKV
jgi:hypothetical protein